MRYYQAAIFSRKPFSTKGRWKSKRLRPFTGRSNRVRECYRCKGLLECMNLRRAIQDLTGLRGVVVVCREELVAV